MRYWFDTEFIEDGKTIELISIGIVASDGREFYAENLDADLSRANQWVKDNVLSLLWSRQSDKSKFNAWSRDGGSGGLLRHKEIATGVKKFLSPDRPELWAYYADYDWIAFCQLFGTMMDLPEGYPMYCRDVKQWCDMLGNPRLPKQSGEHNALEDARWTKAAWNFLKEEGWQ